MSDNEEMTDMSQVMTQSGGSITQSGSNGFTSLSNFDSENRSWGKLDVYKTIIKRLGLRGNIASRDKKKIRTVELVNEKTSFGRAGDYNISDLFDNTKLNEISNVHFTIIKNNASNALSPVFLEDSSRNGTYFSEYRKSTAITGFGEKKKRIDLKSKRRILAHKDLIYVQKNPTICFEFHSYQATKNDLPDDINREYHIGNELGSGACGTVYLAQNRRTCQSFAVKYTSGDRNENTIPTILKEVDILRQLDHPCILKLYATKTYTDSVAIFIDFMQGGDLLNRLSKRGPFSESLTKFVFYQICCGIEYLHKQEVIHRDLKPENILLATTDQYTLVKVSDFGLSKRITSNIYMQTQCGTVAYLAPEVRTSKYTNKVDIWSLGVVLYNCFSGRYPFHDPHSSDIEYTPIDFTHYEFRKVSNEGKNIIIETLQMDAEQRPSAEQLLKERNWLAKSDKSVQRALEIMTISKNLKRD